MRIYLDTAVIIYIVETVEPFVTMARNRLRSPDIDQVGSDLSRLECRVKPVRDGNAILLAAYDHYFDVIASEVLPLSRAVIDRATALRAHYGFKTPDALHLAAAMYS